jgi:light-dependent protochlorophyllide reductase
MSDPTPKSVIVTGGAQGLGFECARSLVHAQGGWHVVIAARDARKAEAAVHRLRGETPDASVESSPLDLASLSSVRDFAESYKHSDRPPLKALVCNAGTQVVRGIAYTCDGFERTFGVNHLGHFLLVNLLLSMLVPPARVVFVSSGTHDPATVEGRFNPPFYENARALARPEEAKVALSNIRRYSTSKLCNVLCAYEFDRRLKAIGRADVAVNAFDPGAVPGTGLTRDYSPLLRLVLTWPPLLRLAGVRVEDAATSGADMARLILDPALEGVSGRYFRGKREAASSKDSYDEGKALDLWGTSAELVALRPGEGFVSSRTSAVG